MTKFDLINRMIYDLDHLTVQGMGNMSIVLHTMENLKTLADGLEKEEKEKKEDKPKLEVLDSEQSGAD